MMETREPRLLASPLHTVAVLAVLGAGAWWSAYRAAQLRASAAPPRLGLYATTFLFEWLLFGLVIWRAPAREVLAARWTSARQVLRDIGIAVAFWAAAAILLVVFGLLLGVRSRAQAVQFMLPQSVVEIAFWLVLSVSAGICEEAVFRGYLQRQFIGWTGSTPAGIAISAAVFGAAHAYQGFRLTVLIALYGAMFGLLAHWRKSVRPGMIAHAWQDSITGLLAALVRVAGGATG